MRSETPSLQRLIGERRPGRGMDQAFYVRGDLFERDMDLLLSGWTCLGHESEIAAPGDWITAGFGAESAIIVRGQDGVARALANVCRHRGSRICVEAAGSAVMLACPYHGWTYHLDGRLRAAREMPKGFDAGEHGLRPLPLTIIGGLMFVSFGDSPPSLADAAPPLAAMTEAYGWGRAKIAARRSYSVAANWKLVLENYHECYHCGPAHPEFSVLHALARPTARKLRTAEESNETGGVPDFEAWGPVSDGREIARVMRSHLVEGALTGSRDGQLVAPPMGPVDGACVFAEVGYLSAFLAYADHGVVYRFIPQGVLTTEMEVIWLVDGAAREGYDYDLEALTWLWDVTSLADKKIIERNQAGVLSRFYAPGPFSLMEPGTSQLVDRYLADLAARSRA
ncbi:MAG TPA: aromatic ring-hydroxylating dioxygenase subunit alpha [Caulobacteraceae bacterium]|jgi:Rieske 2Fe-2S family protein|nr:aromatic ring-hydroxylating dioxygenase subunit alpha [Caulobacteraceae bacterium]